VSSQVAGFVGLSQNSRQAGNARELRGILRAAVPASTPSLRLAVKGFFENGGTSCLLALAGAADFFRGRPSTRSREHELALLCSPDQQSFPNAAPLLARTASSAATGLPS